MKKTSKKIVAVIYLSMLVFGLLTPINLTFAQTSASKLVISASPSTVDKGKTTTITAEITPVILIQAPVEVTFTAGSLNGVAYGTFTPTNAVCSIAVQGAAREICSVGFSTSNAGITGVVPMTASATINNKVYTSDVLNITINDTTPSNIKSGPTAAECAAQTPQKTLDPTTNQCVLNTNTTYTPLVSLPGLPNTQAFDTAQSCAFGTYFNIIFKVIIGICAILAMIMIVYGGIEYMTGGAVSEKENGKATITNAIFGILIALGAYMLLNTLNPQLLNVCLNLPKQNITIYPFSTFQVSGGLTYNGQPISVNFDSEAYPAAKLAEQKTGVDRALVLAVFAQETGSGANTGKCNYLTANMKTGELDYLKKIVGDPAYKTVNMSCSGGGSTHGGAIGYVQFLPSTWYEYRDQAAKILGHQPSAWNVSDALMMEAIYLKALGGSGSDATNQQKAAGSYFGSQSTTVSCDKTTKGTYGQCVMGKKASIQQQIDAEIKAGKITQ